MRLRMIAGVGKLPSIAVSAVADRAECRRDVRDGFQIGRAFFAGSALMPCRGGFQEDEQRYRLRSGRESIDCVAFGAQKPQKATLIVKIN